MLDDILDKYFQRDQKSIQYKNEYNGMALMQLLVCLVYTLYTNDFDSTIKYLVRL